MFEEMTQQEKMYFGAALMFYWPIFVFPNLTGLICLFISVIIAVIGAAATEK